MKSTMPCYGVSMPQVRRVTAEAVRAHPLATSTEWLQAITNLYDDAAFREERYAALILLRTPRYRGHLAGSVLPLLEHLITEGAWWDLVDQVAHPVGDILAADPGAAEPTVRVWMVHPDRWLRRVSIICQLGLRERTDTGLLADAIEANLPPAAGSDDFFIRKGIGWALREYGKTDPVFVRAFVAGHPGLSPLSRREALRRILASTPQEIGRA